MGRVTTVLEVLGAITIVLFIVVLAPLSMAAWQDSREYRRKEWWRGHP